MPMLMTISATSAGSQARRATWRGRRLGRGTGGAFCFSPETWLMARLPPLAGADEEPIGPDHHNHGLFAPSPPRRFALPGEARALPGRSPDRRVARRISSDAAPTRRLGTA